MKKKFYWRSYVSISLFLSFLVIAVSGVVLYLAPPGRVARWISWIMMGFSRGQWEDLHTLFSYLFIVLGVLHLFLFNWNLFFSYLRSRITKKLNRKKEIIFALLTFAVITFFTLAKLPPVYSIMVLGNNISSGWADRLGAPPVPHAEELTINEISTELLGADPAEVINKIRELGYTIESGTQRLDSLAVLNNEAPSVIFNSLARHFKVKFEIKGRNY
jgi:hypothetical protein